MRKYIYFVALNLLCLLSLLVTSCENDSVVNGLSVESGSSVISSDLKIIHSLGFDTTNVVVADSFYVVEGDIVCQNADVSGTIKGTSTVTEMLFLKSTAKINGDINTGKLVVEVGASFTGNCNMGPMVKDIKNVERAETKLQEKTA